MATQAHDLHRSLLRPFILATLRGAGFHSTRASVLDTLLNITERYILLLASTTATHAQNNHNDTVPTITDVRMALQECGVLGPGIEGREGWEEVFRRPVELMDEEVAKGGNVNAGAERARAEKRKREDADLEDVRSFIRWFDGKEYAEVKRVAGMTQDAMASGTTVGKVGVGGEKVQVEDFLTGMRKKAARVGDVDGQERLVGTVLGRVGEREDKGVVVEGGAVSGLREWEERARQMARSVSVAVQESEGNAAVG